MRIASLLLGAALLAWAFLAAASGGERDGCPLGIAFVAAPMSMYLIGAVNPNGAELAAAVAVWAGVLRLLETFRRRAEAPVAVADVRSGRGSRSASIVLVNARALGPLWLVDHRRTLLPRERMGARCGDSSPRVAATGGSRPSRSAGLFSVGWTLSGGSLSNQAEASDAPLVNGTFVRGFTYMIRTTPDYLQQAIGYFGWFDAPLPVWTYWLFVAAFAVLVVLAFIATRRRSVLVLATVVVAAILVPALVQAYSVHQTGNHLAGPVRALPLPRHHHRRRMAAQSRRTGAGRHPRARACVGRRFARRGSSACSRSSS